MSATARGWQGAAAVRLRCGWLISYAAKGDWLMHADKSLGSHVPK